MLVIVLHASRRCEQKGIKESDIDDIDICRSVGSVYLISVSGFCGVGGQ